MKNIPKTKHILKYNLLVIRISKCGMLTSAKPCYHCIKQLMNVKHIKIKNVYYSDPPGIIQCVPFDNLVDAIISKTYYYVSSGYRTRMKNSKLLRILRQIKCE